MNQEVARARYNAEAYTLPVRLGESIGIGNRSHFTGRRSDSIQWGLEER
jgi:hypothetical protein